jgi:hypothetical protein
MALGASMLRFGAAVAVARVNDGARELDGALEDGEELGSEAAPKTAGLFSPRVDGADEDATGCDENEKPAADDCAEAGVDSAAVELVPKLKPVEVAEEAEGAEGAEGAVENENPLWLAEAAEDAGAANVLAKLKAAEDDVVAAVVVPKLKAGAALDDAAPADERPPNEKAPADEPVTPKLGAADDENKAVPEG